MSEKGSFSFSFSFLFLFFFFFHSFFLSFFFTFFLSFFHFYIIFQPPIRIIIIGEFYFRGSDKRMKLFYFLLCFVSFAVCSINFHAVKAESIYQYFQQFEALPLFNEYLLYHESENPFAKTAKTQYRLALAGIKNTSNTSEAFSMALFNWILNDNLFLWIDSGTTEQNR